jgi:peptidyl-prolyl cis-trans isomerase-like protein 2
MHCSRLVFCLSHHPCREHDNTHPITKEPLLPSDLITLHYSRKASGELHDPITFKPFSEHSHIVAIATTGNVFLADSVKGGKDLINDVSFKKYAYMRFAAISH